MKYYDKNEIGTKLKKENGGKGTRKEGKGSNGRSMVENAVAEGKNISVDEAIERGVKQKIVYLKS